MDASKEVGQEVNIEKTIGRLHLDTCRLREEGSVRRGRDGNSHTYCVEHQFRTCWPLGHMCSAQLNWTKSVVFVSVWYTGSFQIHSDHWQMICLFSVRIRASAVRTVFRQSAEIISSTWNVTIHWEGIEIIVNVIEKRDESCQIPLLLPINTAT
jgi:hypothetical protein